MNHTLAHAEARMREAPHALFAVCAPKGNEALLGRGALDRFRARLADPDTFSFVALDDLLERIGAVASSRPELRAWSDGLNARYAAI